MSTQSLKHRTRTETAHVEIHQQNQSLKVWLLTNYPSPYQVELLTALHSEENALLEVRFMRFPETETGNTMPEIRFPHRLLGGAAPKSWRDEFRLHPRALFEAAFGKFDCYILSGLYTSITFIACCLILTLRRKPWAVWLERPRSTRFRVSWIKGLFQSGIGKFLSKRLLKTILRRASRVICIGSAAVEHYRKLGAERSKLLMLPYCCDINRYHLADTTQADAVKTQLNLNGKTVFLFSGQIIERKGVDTAVAAFTKLAREYDDVALILLGEGPDRTELKNSVVPDVKQRVHFTGHVPQTDLPAYFNAADVFVFPSRHDGWGVVVNEACAAGLPIIATHATGAAIDLVEPGENGFLLEPDDVEMFHNKMKFLHDHPESITAFGQRSREIVEHFSVENGSKRFSNHIQETVHSHASR